MPTGNFPIVKTVLMLVMVLLLITGLYLPVSQTEYKSLFNLTKTFSGLSVMLFGGGYVIIPVMRHHVVEIFGWLNKQAFLDGCEHYTICSFHRAIGLWVIDQGKHKFGAN